MGLVNLVLAQTRSAFAALAFGVIVILFFSRRVMLSATLALFCAVLASMRGVGNLVVTFLQRGQDAELLDNWTGRLDWWHFAWQKFLERPLAGYGAYAAGRFLVMAQLGYKETSSLHSSFFEVLVGTGIWGLIPLILALLASWWWLIRSVRSVTLDPAERTLAMEGLGVLAVTTVRGIFSVTLIWHPALLFLSVLGCAEFLRRKQIYARAPLMSNVTLGWREVMTPRTF
jgi:O-antigen ligase